VPESAGFTFQPLERLSPVLAFKDWGDLVSERTWQEIARELANETSPFKRRTLEEELSVALKNGSFQKFGKRDEFSERSERDDSA
jgi:hypothetical protein